MDSDTTKVVSGVSGGVGGALVTGLGVYGIKKLAEQLKYQASRNAAIKQADAEAEEAAGAADSGVSNATREEALTTVGTRSTDNKIPSGLHFYEDDDEDDVPASTSADVSENATTNSANTTKAGATAVEEAATATKETTSEVPDTLIGAAKQMAQEALEQAPAANDVATYSFGMGGDLGPESDEEEIADTTAAAAKNAAQETEQLSSQAGTGAADFFESMADFGGF